MPPSIAPSTLKAIADGPSWLDGDKTLAAMSVRKRRTPSQVCRANFDWSAKQKYYRGRYSEGFKKATIELSESMQNEKKRGRRGCGVHVITSRFNKMVLTSPNDSKLKKSVLINAVQQKWAGLSPVKLGRPVKVPSVLSKALWRQSAMMQVAGEGEASAKKMKAITEGLVTNTKWQGSFNKEYFWRKTRTSHPEIMNPVKAKINEDRRVDWLSYANIMDWTRHAKTFLISIGMAKDEPGIIHGV